MKCKLLVVFLSLTLAACYFPVKLRKHIPEDCTNYKLFIRKDWKNKLYAIVQDSTEIMRVRNNLKAKASFGIGGYYYCDGVKYLDGLVISRSNFYLTGQCQNGIDFLNIDTMRLEFNYDKFSKRVNKRELISMIRSLDSTRTPFFISERDTSKYFGSQVYTFHVSYSKRRYRKYQDRTGNKIEKELADQTKYKRHEIFYAITSDSTYQFYFSDNDSISRIDSNLRFHDTRSFEFIQYYEETYVINYFNKVK